MNLLAAFAERWSEPETPPEPVLEADLDRAETVLRCVLPDSYREEVLANGLPQPTIALLHSIVEGELDLHDLAEFFAPPLIVEETRSWREVGMPADLIAFAGDCQGSLFAFRAGDRRGAVWFYDHDERRAERVSDTFEAWIGQFLMVPYVAPEGEG